MSTDYAHLINVLSQEASLQNPQAQNSVAIEAHYGPGVGLNSLPSLTPLPLPISSVSPPIVIGGQTAWVASSAVMIGSQTIEAGEPPITIAGTPVSLDLRASNLVVGTSTIALPQARYPSVFQPSLFAAGSVTLSANPNGGFIIEQKTLLPNGPVITFSNTPILLGSSGLVVGTQTYAVPTPAPAFLPAGASLTIAGETFIPNPTAFALDGITLVKGGPGITLSGTPVSLGPSGLVIGTAAPIILGPSSVYTTGGKTFTVAPSGNGLLVTGTTVLPGQAVTLDRTAISLVLGSSTIMLSRTASSEASGVLTKAPAPTDGASAGMAVATTPALTTATNGASEVLQGGSVSVTSRREFTICAMILTILLICMVL